MEEPMHNVSTETTTTFISQGIEFIQQQQFAAAITCFTQALDHDPSALYAYMNRAGAYAALSDYQRALADLDRAVELMPEWYAPYYSRGMIYSRMGDLPRAVEAYDRAMACNPSEWIIRLRRAEALCAHDPQQALAAVDDLVAAHPNEAAIYLLRGQIYEQLGDALHAAYDFGRALLLDPQRSDAHTRWQRAAAHAHLQLDRAIAQEPERGQHYFSRGLFRWSLGWREEALADLDRAVEHAPEVMTHHSSRAGLLIELARFADACADLDRAIALEPQLASLYVARAQILARLDKLDDALDDLDRAHQCGMETVDYYLARVAVHRSRGDWDAARWELTDASDLAPDNALLHDELGGALTALGQLTEAEQALRRAVELQPTGERAYRVGVNLLSQERYIEALPYLDDAVQAAPSFAIAHMARGMALANSEREAEALDAYQRAIQIDPTFAPTWAQRAILWLRRQEWQAAISDATRAVTLAPNDPMAYEIRAQARYALGQIREAVQDYQAQQNLVALTSAPDQPPTPVSLAAD
jgi:tetratricopeptide (TPR) repeat protein